MKILLVSSQWSETRKTGLGFVSSIHKEILESLGFTVISVGNVNDKTNYEFKNSGRVDLLIKYFKLSNFIKDIIIREKPDFVFVESLQNIFSEISIIVAKKLKKNIILISHGISIFPYKLNFKYILRFLIWIPYIFFIIFVLKKVNIFLNFDNCSKNLRHFDLFIYKNILRKEKCYQINNFSRFERSNNLKTSHYQSKNKIILSVVAGIKIKSIEDWVKESFSIIRIMPNTPALVRSGVTALYANKNTSDKEKAIAEKIMSSVGKTVWLDKEDQMDSVTALSGSGPAYFFYFMELMENHAIEMGLKKEDAHLLTIETALGAAKMALLSNAELKELRLQVTSPAGTTERAINTFVKGKLHKLLRDAMDAAKKRSVELSESFKD